MNRFFLSFALIVTGSMAHSQAAIERHVWQDVRSFEPYSRTSSAITGTITLSGNSQFAVEGSEMTMTFENGAVAKLTSVKAMWRTWAYGEDRKQTAEVFRFAGDPGTLLHGNTLCGDIATGHKLYAAFFEGSFFDGSPSLNIAVFQSVEPPADINSTGLCGTFSYDASAGLDVVEGSSEDIASGAGSWRVQSETNPIDDTETVTLSLVAESGTSRDGSPIVLIARCKSNKTELFVNWGDYLGDDSNDVYAEWKNVIVRIGSDEAQTERWGVSTDRQATFAPKWAGSMLKDLLTEKRLVLQVVPYAENPTTAVFNVSGLRMVLPELSNTCNWSF